MNTLFLFIAAYFTSYTTILLDQVSSTADIPLVTEIRNINELAVNIESETPASLYLACTDGSERRLLLSTRLPGPRYDYRKGNKDDAFLYVETIEQKMDLKWTLAERGKDDPWGGYLFWRKNLDEPDTLISAPLTGDQIATISRWFGHAPPSEVSIIGFLETGVFMTGKATGKAIADFDASCSAK
ncbi:hypothetical protein [Rhizobium sp. G21]|uniref:hypothetical protein n=1 Tax=Rhizobium sp. G21 TaxID=2758439 RepID=UPI001603970B|nr:hypothetical protein [Rhizobium sp. G21]MBB1248414.1 hypothetical protein [Rhizobium sp. G21]